MHPSTSEPTPPGVEAGVEARVDLCGLRVEVEALGAVDFALVHPESLGDVVTELTRLGDRLAAVRTRAIAAFDARRCHEADGKRSASDWLTERLHVDPREARREARLGRTLDALPEAAAAYSEGAISRDHADVIARAVENPGTPEGQRLASDLLQAAHSSTPGQLAREARRRQIEQLPVEAAELGRAQWAGRAASRTELASGMVRWEIVSDPASAEFLDAAVARLSRPDPTSLPEDQRRSLRQRRHDAMVTLAKAALDREELPARKGPSTCGLVLIDLDTLTAGDGEGRLAAELGTNGPIDVVTARALLCDAGVAPVLTGGDGHVLHLGRRDRTCSDAQRAAVYARDRGCRRCGASVSVCEVHHIIEWEHGGPTDLENLITLCWPCHRELHLAGWSITLHDDLSVTFTLADGRELRRPPPRRPARPAA